VRANAALREIKEIGGTGDELEMARLTLQLACAMLIQSNVKKSIKLRGYAMSDRATRARRGDTLKDIQSRIKGKKGRFRGTMSGKRGDFGARSVIGPDISHDMWELGVPYSIMLKLTFPEHVNDLNLPEMHARVCNGTSVLHGAKFVVKPNGHRVYLGFMHSDARALVADELGPGYIVERHMCARRDWVRS